MQTLQLKKDEYFVSVLVCFFHIKLDEVKQNQKAASNVDWRFFFVFLFFENQSKDKNIEYKIYNIKVIKCKELQKNSTTINYFLLF